uniref:G_PROTEIN_RECEP_F1_2 domain-containing protein n=1 Tax=Heterorhabditis bacteriophora TaxID=37862 RepID=A0A1I7XFV5_HETBA
MNCKVFHLLRYWLITDSCDIYISSYLCMLMRFPPTSCVTAFVVLQLAMVVERAIATYQRDKYEKSQPIYGIILAISSVFIALLVTYLTLRNEDFSSSYAYCSAGSRYTMKSLTTLCFSLCIADIITLLGIVFVHFYNEKALKRKSFELCSSYQIRETIGVIRLLWPLTLFHAIFYAIFSTSNAILPMFQKLFTEIQFRTIFAAAYASCFYVDNEIHYSISTHTKANCF